MGDDPICSSAGCDQYLHPHEKQFKKDYFVPNFGQDNAINQNMNSIKYAEKALGHKWDWKKTEKGKDVLYAEKPLDSDIKDSIIHMSEQEGRLGRWELPTDEDVQINEGSDPICSSAGCT